MKIFAFCLLTLAPVSLLASDCDTKNYTNCVFKFRETVWNFGDEAKKKGIKTSALRWKAVLPASKERNNHYRVPNIGAMIAFLGGWDYEMPISYDQATSAGFWAVPVSDSGFMKRPHGAFSKNQSFAIFYLGVLIGVSNSNIVPKKLDPIYFQAVGKKKFGEPTKDVTNQVNKLIKDKKISFLKSKPLGVSESKISYEKYDSVLYWNMGNNKARLMLISTPEKNDGRGRDLWGKTLVETIALDAASYNQRYNQYMAELKQSNKSKSKQENKGLKDEMDDLKL
jgi:hypothetical protein